MKSALNVLGGGCYRALEVALAGAFGLGPGGTLAADGT